MKRKMIFIIILALMFSSTYTVFASESAIKAGIIDNVKEGDKKIQQDFEIMERFGLDTSKIEPVIENGAITSYHLEVADDVKDVINVKDTGTELIMCVAEGDLYNELIIKEDGKVILDSQEVKYETAMLTSFDISESNVLPRTGGIQWYSSNDAPSYLKNASYGSYSAGWRVANIDIGRSLNSIAYATFVGLVTAGIEGGVIGFVSTAFWELVNYNPNSSHVSYIDYKARSNDNARYFKARRYTYAEANYQGGCVTTYSYGVML